MSTADVATRLGRPLRRSLVRREGGAAPEQEFWVYPGRPAGHRTEVLFDPHGQVQTVTCVRRPARRLLRWVIGDGVATAVVGGLLVGE